MKRPLDIERSIISKMVLEKDFTPVTELGLNRKLFLDRSNQRIYDTLLSLQSEHGSVTLGMMKTHYPEYKFLKVEEPFSFLVEELRDNYAYAETEDSLQEAAVLFDKGDHVDSRAVLSQLLDRLAQDVIVTQDVNLADTVEARLTQYEENRDRDPDELLGIPSGFDLIDQATQGFQPKQLITLVGPPKAGKSTSIALMAISAWKKNCKVLFIGFEMSNEEQSTRIDAFVAHLDHTKLRGGKNKRLTNAEMGDLRESLEEFYDHGDFILSNDTRSALTVSGIGAKIDQYDPDFVIVDGVYMMMDEAGSPHPPGSPQALTNITRGFKRLAQNKNVPILITTQVLEWKMDKGKSITSGSIGYSSSFIQDSDLVMGIERTDDSLIQLMKVVLGRNVPQGVESFIKWEWEKGEFEELGYNPFEEDTEEEDTGRGAGF